LNGSLVGYYSARKLVRAVAWCSFLLLVLSPAYPEGSALTFSPPEWQLGILRPGDRVSTTIRITNTTGSPVSLTVIGTCDCLYAVPSQFVIPARSREDIKLSFHAGENYVGPIRMTYIMETDLKDSAAIFYKVRGTVVKK
jgi:hypothetical protein